jgi:hypothetical protein
MHIYNTIVTFSANSNKHKHETSGTVMPIQPTEVTIYKKLKTNMQKESALIRKMIQGWTPIKVVGCNNWVGYMDLSNHVYLVCHI